MQQGIVRIGIECVTIEEYYSRFDKRINDRKVSLYRTYLRKMNKRRFLAMDKI